jgi:uncharacterized protein
MRGPASEERRFRTFQPPPYPCPVTVLYHDPCMDGFGAAYAAWLYYGSHARYVGAQYDAPLPEIPADHGVVMLDFSAKRDEMRRLIERHGFVVVLDHHASAEAELAGIETPWSSIVEFSSEHSGAVMAWQHFHGTAVPDLIRYIEDRDLWKHALPHSKQVNAALSSYPREFEVWHDLMMGDVVGSLAREGAGILRNREAEVRELTNHATAVLIGTHVVPAVNAPHFLASDLGNALLARFPEAPFAAVYTEQANGTRKWSLRSSDDRFDVMQVAVTLGGGGHRNASGFVTTADGRNKVIRLYTRYVD